MQQGKLLTILIADNDTQSVNHLSSQLSDQSGVKQVLTSNTVESTLYRIISDLPDVVFMDLGRQGIDLLELLRKNKFFCKIVITSDSEDSVINAIQNNVYDFLLKPVEYEAVSAIINQTFENKNELCERKTSRLFENDGYIKLRLSTSSEYIFVDPKEIVYCESNGQYTKIFLNNGSSELVNYYLGKVSGKLSPARFFRISRFYLINLEKLLKVNKMEGFCILMSEKGKITLEGTRKYLRNLCGLDF